MPSSPIISKLMARPSSHPIAGAPIHRPKIHRTIDMYYDYVRKLLAEHPEYWSKYDKRVKHYWIFRKATVAGRPTIETVINYTEFRKIVETYFMAASEAIIMGSALNLGNRLGIIAPRRVERNFAKKMVNFAETKKQPIIAETGKRATVVYFDDDDWVRIGWEKVSRVAGVCMYKFVPTPDDGRGGGFKERFSQANILNQFLKFKYTYFPYLLDQEEYDKREVIRANIRQNKLDYKQQLQSLKSQQSQP